VDLGAVVVAAGAGVVSAIAGNPYS